MPLRRPQDLSFFAALPDSPTARSPRTRAHRPCTETSFWYSTSVSAVVPRRLRRSDGRLSLLFAILVPRRAPKLQRLRRSTAEWKIPPTVSITLWPTQGLQLTTPLGLLLLRNADRTVGMRTRQRNFSPTHATCCGICSWGRRRPLPRWTLCLLPVLFRNKRRFIIRWNVALSPPPGMPRSSSKCPRRMSALLSSVRGKEWKPIAPRSNPAPCSKQRRH